MRKLLVLIALLASLTPVAQAREASFKVLAFYHGTWDPAHISFVREANRWFPRAAAENGFAYESTTNWNRLTDQADLSRYQVVMFLDDHPDTAAQRTGFQQYMNNGGGWFGFHVSAFTQNSGEWSWFHNQFLGTGDFVNNTWEPTTALLRAERHPSTTRLPDRFTSSVSEWYGWRNDLRRNPDIQVLASVDPAGFPLGTDPDQQWRSGYYPIIWTNKSYRMLYANFGHDAMDYPTNTPKSSTFASETQNRFLVDGLRWLGQPSAR